MNNPFRGDKKMLKQFNYTSDVLSSSKADFKPDFTPIIPKNKREIIEKQNNLLTSIGTDKMDDMDIFLTLVLKNLSANERFLLLNKLLNMDWDNADDTLEKHLSELINKKKSDEELKKTLDYEYFLWDFKNWKNYFLSESKDEPKD